MNEVSTTLHGKVYTYKFNGKFYTWFDAKNLPVPVIIHSKLREQAIAEGKDESIFLSTPKPPHSERVGPPEKAETKTTASTTKKKQTAGFNPFAKGE